MTPARKPAEKPPSTVDPSAEVQRILAAVDAIPLGRVAAYGDVARDAGLPRRARLVGRVLSRLPSGSQLAWHRVVDAGGRIRVAGASAREQRRRLKLEGVEFAAKNRVDQAFFVVPRHRPAR
ncbi:MAG: MGMT family protein [Planctomycetes bacterium]|nr:MGMT family protein [Planctomycetota bacterium]